MRRILAAVLVLAAASASARRPAPLTIELDGCVLPSTACAETADVVELTIDDVKRRFAVEALRFVSMRSASTGKILSELRLRGLRVTGPAELTARLEPGGRRRMRGMLRLEVWYLLLQAVEPLPNRK